MAVVPVLDRLAEVAVRVPQHLRRRPVARGDLELGVRELGGERPGEGAVEDEGPDALWMRCGEHDRAEPGASTLRPCARPSSTPPPGGSRSRTCPIPSRVATRCAFAFRRAGSACPTST